jgi:hypothetical protein
VGTGPPGAEGSKAAVVEAGSASEGSARVDGSGAAAAVPGSTCSCTALAALMTSKTLLSKWARAGSSSDRGKTHSVDFFLAAFFTRQARQGMPVADGEAWLADGGVPATAIVTAAAAEGPVSTPSGSVPGGRAGRLQEDTVSMQHHYLAKKAIQYLEDSTSCALRLRTCRWPFGTGGRAPAKSTLWSEELSRWGPPSVPSLTCELTQSVDSLLP